MKHLKLLLSFFIIYGCGDGGKPGAQGGKMGDDFGTQITKQTTINGLKDLLLRHKSEITGKLNDISAQYTDILKKAASGDSSSKLLHIYNDLSNVDVMDNEDLKELFEKIMKADKKFLNKDIAVKVGLDYSELEKYHGKKPANKISLNLTLRITKDKDKDSYTLELEDANKVYKEYQDDKLNKSSLINFISTPVYLSITQNNKLELSKKKVGDVNYEKKMGTFYMNPRGRDVDNKAINIALCYDKDKIEMKKLQIPDLVIKEQSAPTLNLEITIIQKELEDKFKIVLKETKNNDIKPYESEYMGEEDLKKNLKDNLYLTVKGDKLWLSEVYKGRTPKKYDSPLFVPIKKDLEAINVNLNYSNVIKNIENIKVNPPESQKTSSSEAPEISLKISFLKGKTGALPYGIKLGDDTSGTNIQSAVKYFKDLRALKNFFFSPINLTIENNKINIVDELDDNKSVKGCFTNNEDILPFSDYLINAQIKYNEKNIKNIKKTVFDGKVPDLRPTLDLELKISKLIGFANKRATCQIEFIDKNKANKIAHHTEYFNTLSELKAHLQKIIKGDKLTLKITPPYLSFDTKDIDKSEMESYPVNKKIKYGSQEIKVKTISYDIFSIKGIKNFEITSDIEGIIISEGRISLNLDIILSKITDEKGATKYLLEIKDRDAKFGSFEKDFESEDVLFNFIHTFGNKRKISIQGDSISVIEEAINRGTDYGQYYGQEIQYLDSGKKTFIEYIFFDKKTVFIKSLQIITKPAKTIKSLDLKLLLSKIDISTGLDSYKYRLTLSYDGSDEHKFTSDFRSIDDVIKFLNNKCCISIDKNGRLHIERFSPVTQTPILVKTFVELNGKKIFPENLSYSLGNIKVNNFIFDTDIKGAKKISSEEEKNKKPMLTDLELSIKKNDGKFDLDITGKVHMGQGAHWESSMYSHQFNDMQSLKNALGSDNIYQLEYSDTELLKLLAPTRNIPPVLEIYTNTIGDKENTIIKFAYDPSSLKINAFNASFPN